MVPQLPPEYLHLITSYTRLIQQPEAGFFGESSLSVWEFLSQSETAFLNRSAKNKIAGISGAAEFGLALFILNHQILEESKTVFRKLGMPDSVITPQRYKSEFLDFDNKRALLKSKIVGPDGTLFLDIPYGQFDPGWAMAGILNIFRSMRIIHDHKFIETPAIVTSFAGQESLTVCLIGDWGTGLWKDGKYDPPSKLIADAIKNMPVPPDIIIHLGDVYYSGLKSEEQRNLLDMFPTARGKFNFTLNSNHEMYSGAHGYFDNALKDPMFSCQTNGSYFAIKFMNWVILGLDSAYFDRSAMVLKGALADDNSVQKDFIRSLNISAHHKIILLTHHPGMDYNGMEINRLLVQQVYEALGNIYPDYWYYGHIHNGIVYNQFSAVGDPTYQTRSGTYPRLRCVGHSAIPFGPAELGENPGIDYWAHNPLPDPDEKQEHRVLNGFAMLSLREDAMTENMFEVCPVKGLINAYPGLAPDIHDKV
jgi:hypothetical protein